ncbi:NlpC/P60 family protein [Nonomuraea rubra]|uniref:NlpC/P60 family protein n=1 Tax=Nonomuraea rubra TaxID=46180 RepID=UPI003CC65022
MPRAQIQPGDLVFYETDSTRSGPDHVGLALNDAEMVNAPHTGALVRSHRQARLRRSGAPVLNHRMR